MVVTLPDLSPEVLLRILGYLDDARDVARVRQTSRRLRDVGRDEIVWKRLFARIFLINPTKEVDVVNVDRSRRRKRQHISGLETSSTTDWYTLYKISHNWQTGNYSARQLDADKKGEASTSGTTIADGCPSGIALPETIVASTKDLVFTASRDVRTCGETGHLQAFAARGGKDNSPLKAIAHFELPNRTRRSAFAVSAMTVEPQTSEGSVIRLFLTCSDSTVRVVDYDAEAYTFKQQACQDRAPQEAVALVAARGPFIATCARDFKICAYFYDAEAGSLRRIGQAQSHSCLWPASMRFDVEDSRVDSARLTFACVKQTYPSGWTIAVQQFDLDIDRLRPTGSASAARFFPHSRTINDATSRKGKQRMAKPADRGIERLTSICFEDPFIVVGSKDNSVFCFRVNDGATHLSPVRQQLAVRHLRTLQGHTGAVHSVSLDDNRCVTGGGDGSVRVWRLSDESAYLSQTFGLTARLRTKVHGEYGNVVTLRIPEKEEEEEEEGEVPRKRRKGDEEQRHHAINPFTLAGVLRNTAANKDISTPSSVIRWVASAFDRVITVSQSYPTCAAEARNDDQRSSFGEQVQIWSFS